MFDAIKHAAANGGSAKDQARRRLHDTLIQDRVDLAPEVMEALKRDLLGVITRYMEAPEGFQEFEVRRENGWPVLVCRLKVREHQSKIASININ
ncbi:MAG: cell division topological specificity factor [SAR202 cluster bacterium]|nr:cell division topological specificity factor [SAR202 cluster bacterium]